MKLKLQQRSTKLRTSVSEPLIRSHDEDHPIFSLQFMVDRYCVSECDKNERSAFVLTLRALSKQTWRDLKMRGRHKGGFEKIPCDQMNFSVPTYFGKDSDCLVFRFSGMKSMIGFRKGNVYHIIALDRNFTAYRHC